jgi:hypothetical protein
MTLTEFRSAIHQKGYKPVGWTATGDDWSMSYVDPSTPQEIRSVAFTDNEFTFGGGDFETTVQSVRKSLAI